MPNINIEMNDIWVLKEQINKAYVVIPTNLTVKRNGDAVMGRGIAKQATKYFHNIAKIYGNALRDNETSRGFYIRRPERLIMLPVKNDWHMDADLKIIEKGLRKLVKLLELDDGKRISTALLPAIGCGFGGLLYEAVLPLILKYYHPRITLVIADNTVYSHEVYRESFLPAINNKKDKRVSLSGQFSDIEM